MQKTPKIVYLDGYTLNHGDLDWSALLSLGEVSIYDRSSVEETLERAKDAEIVLTNKALLTESMFQHLPKLKYVGVTATGYNNVNVAAAQKAGIITTNVRGYSSNSVAQHTFALLLSLSNRLNEHLPNAAEEWQKAADWCYYKSTITELSGKTLGIIGLGNIGKKVAEIAQAFGMNVIATKRHLEKTEDSSIELLALEDLLKKSDYISLHCPQTPENKEFINKSSLELMKKTAYLINTARGSLIQENDLADALNTGRLAGAALDVLSQEPPLASNPLLTAKNCLLTPHQAWASIESRQKLLSLVVENIQAFLAGKPSNVVT